MDPKAQVNLTDADSRIMKVQGQGFEPCDNAQLAGNMDSRLKQPLGSEVTRSDVPRIHTDH